MPKHKGGKVAAVIDIGSSDVKMQISQVRNKEIIPLNTLEFLLNWDMKCLTTAKSVLNVYANFPTF